MGVTEAWRVEGPKTWTPKLHQAVIDKMGDDEHVLRLFSGRCSAQLRGDLLREFEDMIERFVKRASLEIKTQPTVLQPLAVSLAMAPLRVGLTSGIALRVSWGFDSAQAKFRFCSRYQFLRVGSDQSTADFNAFVESL